MHARLVILKDEQLFVTHTSLRNYQQIHNDTTSLNSSVQEDSLKLFQYPRSNLISFYKNENKILSKFEAQPIPPLSSIISDNYIPFINAIITQDDKYIGKVQFCVQENRNAIKLVFNIINEYQFRSKKETHHRRNYTAIIV
jgi:hypothetical protein